MKQQFKQFVLRLAVCSAGLWISTLLFNTVIISGRKVTALILGGLILALANAIIKAQNKEIADMKAWYKVWYGVELK